MREIPVVGGALALVDNADYRALVRYEWRLLDGYAVRDHRNTLVRMHSMVLPARAGFLVDHRSHNTLDNQRINLRYATHQQNAAGARKRDDCSSQFKGVSLDRRRGTWSVFITANRKTFFLGSFKTEIDAAREYNRAAVGLFGEYAALNFLADGGPQVPAFADSW